MIDRKKVTRISLITDLPAVQRVYLIRFLKKVYPDIFVINVCRQPVEKGFNSTVPFFLHGLQAFIARVLFSYSYPPLGPLFPQRETGITVPDFSVPEIDDLLNPGRTNLLIIAMKGREGIQFYRKGWVVIRLQLGYFPYFTGWEGVFEAACQNNFCNMGYAISRMKDGSLNQMERVYASERVVPRFFEPFQFFLNRVFICAVERLSEILPLIIDEKLTGILLEGEWPLPSVQTSGSSETMFKRAETNFSGDQSRLFKATLSSTNRFESVMRKIFVNNVVQRNLADGWYIVAYHDVIDDPDFSAVENFRIPSIYTSKKNFGEHVRYFNNNFEIISLKDGYRLYERNKKIDGRYLTITFDDGLKSVESAIEILQAMKIVPCIFLNTSSLVFDEPLHNHRSLFLAQFMQANPQEKVSVQEKLIWDRDVGRAFAVLQKNNHFRTFVQEKYLNKDYLIKALKDNAIEVGSHTKSHRHLNIDELALLIEEITGAHHDLEQIFERKIDYFSFPFGTRDDINFKAEYVAMQTARICLSCQGGINRRKCNGPLLRIGIHNEQAAQLEPLFRRQYVR